MSLTNSQFDAVMRIYNERQLRARREQDARIDEVFAKIPRVREIQAEIASLSVRKAHVMLDSDTGEDFDLKDAIASLAEERDALLLAHGYPADYLERHYECPICHDTGFVNGRKCSCFRREEIRFLYSGSSLSDVLEKESFQNFRLDYYSDSEKNENGMTSREAAENALRIGREFARTFHSAFDNLYIYGDTGVGKSFLSHCIAGELIRRGYSVLYLTAYDLFQLLEDRKFSHESGDRERADRIFDCDLLIIDDLGTEMANSFTTSQFFVCVNERYLHRKPVIISTNLSIRKIAENYSERTTSRIFSEYTMVPLFGRDIRILRQISGGNENDVRFQ